MPLIVQISFPAISDNSFFQVLGLFSPPLNCVQLRARFFMNIGVRICMGKTSGVAETYAASRARQVAVSRREIGEFR